MLRRFIPLFMVLTLVGCGTPGAILTGSVNNPVTPKIAYQLQASIDEVAVAAGTYAKLPRCSTNPAPCSSQTVVNQLRKYVNAGEAAAGELDKWALGNTKLDGQALYKAAVLAITTAQNFALVNGVK